MPTILKLKIAPVNLPYEALTSTLLNTTQTATAKSPTSTAAFAGISQPCKREFPNAKIMI